MFTNIEKELRNTKGKLPKKPPIQREMDSTKAFKELETEEASRDARIMRALGGNHILAREDDAYTKRFELKVLDDKYNGGVYTSEQIKAICVKYRLRFLPTKYFKGNISVKTLAAIKKFAKESNVELNAVTAAAHFSIMAPVEEFNLRLEKSNEQSWASYKVQTFLDFWRDPALFYYIEDDKYKLVRKWGVMFTIPRLIQGFKWKNRTNLFFYTLFLWGALGSIVSMFLLRLQTTDEGSGWFKWFGIIIACLFPVAKALNRVHTYSGSKGGEKSGFFTHDNWNSPCKTTL